MHSGSLVVISAFWNRGNFVGALKRYVVFTMKNIRITSEAILKLWWYNVPFACHAIHSKTKWRTVQYEISAC